MPTWLIVMLIVIILGASSAWLVFLARYEYDRLPEREMMCTKCGKTFYPEKTWSAALFSVHQYHYVECPHCRSKGFMPYIDGRC
ncbi:MAG: hypothetical protein IKP68_01715 [Clostridia bacterium]|nr:hypothetical protein [Clostridia bacterium]